MACASVTVTDVSSLLHRPVERPALRVVILRDADRGQLARLIDEDPIVNAVISSRLRGLGTVEPRTFGGLLIGARTLDGTLRGAAFSGGNLLPIGGGIHEWQALATNVLARDRICSSIVGRADAVAGMWEILSGAWGPARTIRRTQRLLVLDRAAGPDGGDDRVRPMRPEELDAYLPAAVAMFTEELGVAPQRAAHVGDYRRRVAGLIQEGRAFGILDRDGTVIFKADVGAVSPDTCQVQGVWVRPDLRGRGIGTAALVPVLRHALTLAPSVSLYVNDFNVAARRIYDRLGMRETAVLSTILF
jgi:predicted GNAT family acetyltransferase